MSKHAKKSISKALGAIAGIAKAQHPPAKNVKFKKAVRDTIASIASSAKRSNHKTKSSSGIRANLGSGMSRHKTVIEEDEYVGDILGSVAFATTQYPCNIGQAKTFPWGSTVAPLWEKYHFGPGDYIEFYYKRLVSEYNSNGTSGMVMFSFDYDCTDNAPTTRTQVLDTDPHKEWMPCDKGHNSLKLSVAEFAKQPSIYIRPGLQPANTDLKLYDKGNLYVSTYNCAATTAVGELHVRYRLTLDTPVLVSSSSSANAGAYSLFASPVAGEPAAATTVYVAQFLAANNPVVVTNQCNITLSSVGLFTLPPGTYLITYSAHSFNTSVNVTGGNCVLSNVVTADTGLIKQAGMTASIIGDPGGYTTYMTAYSPSIVWNTAVWGTSLAMQVECVYASGSAFNNCSISFTQL